MIIDHFIERMGEYDSVTDFSSMWPIVVTGADESIFNFIAKKIEN